MIFSGNHLPDGAEPVALAYAGHQFGGFVPQLGDGRAVLLGEVVDRHGSRFDIQLKGAGRTPFSRRGDGRAPLGPVLREYLVSETMHALGVPTTRALAAVTTGETVYREAALPGAVITRVAASHIRVGTFQYFAARGDSDNIRKLADYVIDRHYPEVKGSRQPYLALLEAVIQRQAKLVAKWMSLGFIHGVMNTDNMSIAGETIDYGPCAFMDNYHPHTVYSFIDSGGRYAYQNQPTMAQWNLARFAETLLGLLADDEQTAIERATEAVKGFTDQYEKIWLDVMRGKLGLERQQDSDRQLLLDVLRILANDGVDFTLFFRRLADLAEAPKHDESVTDMFRSVGEWQQWLQRWRERCDQEALPAAERAALMRRSNPAFIPRNHRVEQAIAAAIDHNDFSIFERLCTILQHPFQGQPDDAEWMAPPRPEEAVSQTFCGT